ncbi:unnamed protein product [Brassicogethes aeneus]|uniref:Phosphatidic acid phosphatase type 2/haloperoxidase domain-containing protein n=1 Tax=Brassicogethes aeneus TaxID=1431903 RepID=A0A9P0AZG8_BRAAE|nr:unnamed protein product [Brassicogethes aeneus]
MSVRFAIEIENDSEEKLLDNKVMNETAAPSGRQPRHMTTITINDSKAPNAPVPRIRCRLPRFRLQHFINILIIAIVVPLLYLIEYGYIPGNKLGFTCRDPILSHKYTGDTITMTTLLIGTVLVPLLVIVLVELLKHGSVKLRDFWIFYKEFLIGECFVLMVTELGKILVGEHRPHFFDVCRPIENELCQNGTYVESYTCSNERYTRYFLVDSSRSFPSGHSSVGWFAALFSAYIIQSRLPTEKTGRLLKPLLVAVCVTWGLICSLSRIVDHRHHWWDVLTGSLLGIAGAIYTLHFMNSKLYRTRNAQAVNKISTSTTTLLDVKNKDATSVII